MSRRRRPRRPPATCSSMARVMLGAALVFVTLFRKLGLGATLGYIVGGALIGPHVLGLIGDADAIMAVSEIGIALLLFLVGLELNPSRLWRLRKDIFGLGLIQVVLCGVALGGADLSCARLQPRGQRSRSACRWPCRRPRRCCRCCAAPAQLNTRAASAPSPILLFQDLSIVPMITIIAAMSRAPADPTAPPGWMLALYTVGAIVGLVLAGRFILNPLVPADRPPRRARAVRRRRPVHGDRQRSGDGGAPPVDRAGRVHRRRDARRIALPARARKRRRAVPLDPARPVLPLGRHAARFPRDRRSAACSSSALAVGDHRRQGGDHRRPRLRCSACSWAGRSGSACCSARPANSASSCSPRRASALLIPPEAATLFGAIVTLSMVSTPFLMQLDRVGPRRMPEPPRRPRRAGILARDQRDRRRLRPLRPDRRADADGQAHPGHPHRQQAVADRAQPRSSAPRSIMATAPGSTCSGPPGPRRPRRSCSARTAEELTRDKLRGGARGVPAGGDHGPGLRPAAGHRVRRARCRRVPSASSSKARW